MIPVRQLSISTTLTALLIWVVAPAAQAQARPVFEDGQAQIVPAFEDAAAWIRHDLWVETEFDSDGDGKLDRMHVDVTRPSQTNTERLRVPVQASLRCYPCPQALRMLRDLGVRSHVVHLNRMDASARRALERELALSSHLPVAQRFDDTLVIELSPAAAPRSRLPNGTHLDRRHWRATSSKGPRDVTLAFDSSVRTFWSTAMELEDLRHPMAGLRLLQGLRSWQDLRALIPRDEEWFALDLGARHAVRRLSLVFSERGGPLQQPSPTIQGSSDGSRWVDLAVDPVVWPSVRALNEARGRARFEYRWPPTMVRHLRVRHPGYWFLYDVTIFE